MIPFLLLVIIPILFVGGISYWSAYTNYRQSMEEKANLSLRQVIAQLEQVNQKVMDGEISLAEAKRNSEEQLYRTWKSELVIIEEAVIRVLHSDSISKIQPHVARMNQRSGRIIMEDTWFQSYLLYVSYDPWKWRIGMIVRVNPFSQALTNIQKYTLITVVIASIFAVQATILLAHHIAKPLKRLAEWFDQVRDGQPFDPGEENKGLFKRKDEIGVLVDAFRQMLRQMEERKQMEVQLTRLERLASLGELAAGMAHEIRNPLTGMKTAVQVLQKRLNGNEQNDLLLAGIQAEIERLNRLTIQLVHFAKPQLSQLQRVDIRQVLEETLALLDQPIREKKINMEVSQTNISAQVFYDPDHLKQICLNLLLNATKAVPPETGRIGIHIAEDDEQFRIIIADNGPGIPPEHADKIFNPFFTTDPKGTGLGLSVVHRLVTEHGGQIDARSDREGAGTVFTFTIPKKRRNPFGKTSGHY